MKGVMSTITRMFRATAVILSAALMGACAVEAEPEGEADPVETSEQALGCTPGAVTYRPPGNLGRVCRSCYKDDGQPGAAMSKYVCTLSVGWIYAGRYCATC